MDLTNGRVREKGIIRNERRARLSNCGPPKIEKNDEKNEQVQQYRYSIDKM